MPSATPAAEEAGDKPLVTEFPCPMLPLGGTGILSSGSRVTEDKSLRMRHGMITRHLRLWGLHGV
jgi:hypothetical protein